MNNILAFSVGGEKYKITEKGKLDIKQKRALPRKPLFGDKNNEKEYLNFLKNEKFTEDFSLTFKWLTKVFSERIVSYQKVRSVAEFFAFVLGIPLTRDVYRRRICCMYWLETNILSIRDFLERNPTTVFFNKDRVTQLTPPDLEFSLPGKIEKIVDENKPVSNDVLPDFYEPEFNQMDDFLEKEECQCIDFEY